MKPFPFSHLGLGQLQALLQPDAEQASPTHPFWKETDTAESLLPRSSEALGLMQRELHELSTMAALGRGNVESRLEAFQQRLEEAERLFQSLGNHVLSHRDELQQLRAIESRFSIIATATGTTAEQLEQNRMALEAELAEVQLRQDSHEQELESLQGLMADYSEQLQAQDLNARTAEILDILAANRQEQQGLRERLEALQTKAEGELQVRVAEMIERQDRLERKQAEKLETLAASQNRQAERLEKVAGRAEKAESLGMETKAALREAEVIVENLTDTQHRDRLATRERFSALQAQLQEQLEALAGREDTRHTSIEGRLKAMGQELEELLAKHTPQEEVRVETRFEHLEKRSEALNSETQGLQERLDVLASGVEAQAQAIAGVEVQGERHLDQLREELNTLKAESAAEHERWQAEGLQLKARVEAAIGELHETRDELRNIRGTVEPLIESAIASAMAARKEEMDRLLEEAIAEAVPALEAKAMRGLFHLQSQLSHAVTDIGHLRRSQQLYAREIEALREALTEIESDLNRMAAAGSEVAELRQEHARLATRIHSIVGMLSRPRTA